MVTWTQGDPFPIVNGSVIFPPKSPSLSPSLTPSYDAHWYAGSIWPWWPIIAEEARTICVSITVPNASPRSDEFYYVLLSVFDDNGSYNQIGFSDCYGVWGLTYSWTTGPLLDLTYHFDANAMPLSLGVTYLFNITTIAGQTNFTVYQDSNLVWSLNAPTGGNHLVLDDLYWELVGDYTNYEEIWITSIPGGSPQFDFYFYNNYWISTDGVRHDTVWDTYLSGQPSNVGVVISGNSVLLDNPTVLSSITLLPAGSSPPISGTNYFEVSYTQNGQPQVAYAQNNMLTLIVDSDTNLEILGKSSSSNSSEEWVLNSQGSSVTIPAGSTATFYYYDLLSQQVAYLTGSGPSINPILTYYTAPSTSSSQSNPTTVAMNLPYFWQEIIMVLRGTTVSISNNILGTEQDQWVTPIASWNVSQPNQIDTDIFYYHEYQVIAAYSTSDETAPSSAPLLSGTQLGSNYQLFLTTTNQTVWLDENTPWFTSNIVEAPTGNERWTSLELSGNVTGSFLFNKFYTHQYYLAVASAYSSVSGSGWYNAGSTAYASVNSGTVSDGTGTQYLFSSWNTGGTNYTQSSPITMNSPVNATAIWNTQYYLTVDSAYGLSSGSGWYNAGSLATFNVTSPVSGGSGIQYAFNSWAGSGSGSYSGNSISGICQMNAPTTESASWNTQYYLTVASAYGSPTGGGWYSAGTTATFSVITPFSGDADTQYVLASWSGSGVESYNGSSASYSVTMSSPITETASWITQYYFSVDNGGWGTVAGSGWYDSGSSVQATISPIIVAGEVGTQYVFSGWSVDASGSGSTSNSINMNSPKTANASWTTQYQLTFRVNPSESGLITPAGNDVWVNSGPLAITVAPNSAYTFSQWIANSSYITFLNSNAMSTTANVDGPGTITANFSPDSAPTPSPSPSPSPSPTASPNTTPIPSLPSPSLSPAPSLAPAPTSTPSSQPSPLSTPPPEERPLFLYVIAVCAFLAATGAAAFIIKRRR